MARLRILGGKARGRTLVVPESARPSPVRIRKALFDLLRSRKPQKGRFLDLYAGSGAVGLEAASEGYQATLVEADATAARMLRQNAAKLDLSVRIHQGSVEQFLRGYSSEKFDVVFVDPPYDQDLAAIFAKVVEAGILKDTGMAVLQHPKELELPFAERRVYGSSALTIVEV